MRALSIAVRLAVFFLATLIVPLSASAQTLSVTPTSLNLAGSQGTVLGSRTINVSNTGSRKLRWSVSSPSAGWLTVSPTSGTDNGTITVSFPSAFGAGTTSAFFTVQDRSGASVRVTVNLSIAAAPAPAPLPAPAPSPSAIGPQATITCPSGAVDIFPGISIQAMVNNYGGGTTFCLRTGIHPLTSSITPKSNDVFVGEYGAILDGSGWSTGDDTQAAFRSHNQDIDYVTIRNLVIRNMPQRGIHAFYYMSDHWTIEYNEITNTKDVAIVFPSDTIIRNNYIHHNSFSGYMGSQSNNSTFDTNEIAYNGFQQKVLASANVTFRNNFVHHNAAGGIWYDGESSGALVENNRVEDNGSSGIWYEISSDIIVRNNTIRRNGDAGVFISTSKNAQIYNNTLEGNFRGITYLVNCPAVGSGAINADLSNNTAHGNTISVSSQSGAFASAFNYVSCTSAQAAPYLNGSKNNTYSGNVYHVPSPSSQYWYWVTLKYWSEWQGLPQDAGSSVSP